MAKKKDEPAKTQQRRVGVIVPAYAASAFVADCIQSILEQELPADTEIAVVVVCDGDRETFDACRPFAGKISAALLRRRSGPGVCINTALDIAGDLDHFTIVCADDTIEPDHLKSALAAHSKGKSLKGVIGEASAIDQSGAAKGKKTGEAPSASIVWSSAVLSALGGYMPWYGLHADDFKARALRAGAKVVPVEHCTYRKRTHPLQSSNDHAGKLFDKIQAEKNATADTDRPVKAERVTGAVSMTL